MICHIYKYYNIVTLLKPYDWNRITVLLFARLSVANVLTHVHKPLHTFIKLTISLKWLQMKPLEKCL